MYQRLKEYFEPYFSSIYAWGPRSWQPHVFHIEEYAKRLYPEGCPVTALLWCFFPQLSRYFTMPAAAATLMLSQKEDLIIVMNKKGPRFEFATSFAHTHSLTRGRSSHKEKKQKVAFNCNSLAWERKPPPPLRHSLCFSIVASSLPDCFLAW